MIKRIALKTIEVAIASLLAGFAFSTADFTLAYLMSKRTK